MWNVRLGHEHAGLDFWLSSIACHAPKAPVLVIGTHVDQVEKFWLPEEALKKRFPQIVAFHSVSSYTGQVSIQKSYSFFFTTISLEFSVSWAQRVFCINRFVSLFSLLEKTTVNSLTTYRGIPFFSYNKDCVWSIICYVQFYPGKHTPLRFC